MQNSTQVMLKQKQVLTIIYMLCTSYVAMAGNGQQSIEKYAAGTTELNSFNTLSTCFDNYNNNFQLVDGENDLYAARNFYPAYSFNVLKKALYAYAFPVTTVNNKKQEAAG